MSIVPVLTDLEHSFEFEPENSLFIYEFGFASDINYEYIDICTHFKDSNQGWIMGSILIERGIILWNNLQEENLHLTSEVKDHIDKVFNLRAFW